jgi:hypothetical protein
VDGRCASGGHAVDNLWMAGRAGRLIREAAARRYLSNGEAARVPSKGALREGGPMCQCVDKPQVPGAVPCHDRSPDARRAPGWCRAGGAVVAAKGHSRHGLGGNPPAVPSRANREEPRRGPSGN